MLVDLPSGLDRVGPAFIGRARRLLLVGSNEPTSLTDNYALVKLTRCSTPRPLFVANAVADAAEGRVKRRPGPGLPPFSRSRLRLSVPCATTAGARGRSVGRCRSAARSPQASAAAGPSPSLASRLSAEPTAPAR
ncbi:MAG: hypothetical protein R3D25_04870 [Geminicoccaceae bacterium]